MSTKTLNGIEIFAVGRWNADTFTVDDIDSMVNAFNSLGHSGKVPLKLGHEGPDGRIVAGERDKKGNLKDPMSQLAMGWVTRIYREGQKLLADVEVPEKVYSLIQDKFLKFVSVELFREVRTSRSVFPWVLDAVALLGSDPPAVGILMDIQTVAMSAREALSHEGIRTFSRAEGQSINSGVKKSMAGEITLESLSEKLLALTNQVSGLSTENSNLKAQLAEAAVVSTNFKTLQVNVEQEKVKTHRAAIKARFERAIKDGDILPVVRDRFLKAFKVDSCDQTLMGLDLEQDVEAHIKAHPNPNKKRDDATLRKFTVQNVTDELPDDMPADRGMVVLMQAQLVKNGVTGRNPTAAEVIRATEDVMRANPGQAKKYTSQVADIESGAARIRAQLAGS